MHRAVDYLGKEVSADHVGGYSSGFRCPCCGEPVFHKKRGVERRAHFAHFSSSPDCQLYYPGSGDYATSKYFQIPGVKNRGWREATNGASLYLKVEGRHQASLQIRLPVLSKETELQGSVTVDSSYGLRAPISTTSLSKVIYLAVPMNCPPATCTAAGGAEAIASEIERALSEFRFANNFFRASPVGGVLLHPDDPLEAGTSYWLITQSPLRSGTAQLGLKVEEYPDSRGWRRYLLWIPSQEVLGRPTIQESLEQLLGRAIRSASKRAIFVYPLPHHFDPDGIGVYGQETSSILVRCPDDLEIHFSGTATLLGARQEIDSWSGFVRISGLGPGDLVLSANGLIHDRVRIRDCMPFRPPGVRIQSDQSLVELFEPAATVLLRTNAANVEVHVPTQRSWRLIRISGSKINPLPDACSLVVHGPLNDIQAENFGSIFPIRPVQTDTEPNISAANQELAMMLSALSLKHSGASAAASLQTLQLHDPGAAARWANKFGLQWLYPQVAMLTKTEDQEQ